MALIVQKYGGTSVGSVERIQAVAQRVYKTVQRGNSLVVVVSAMGKTTDGLVKLANAISNNPSRREMDMLLSTGEQVTIALLSMALQEIGQPAISMTGAQVGIVTEAEHTRARILRIETERMERYLNQGKVVVVAGFQGISSTEELEITTLGRGGSDTSAVALAAALKANFCEIYTDVPGILTTDPRLVPEAQLMAEITSDEMLELASLGAKVLHPRAVEIARNYGVPLVVKSSWTEDPGTWVTSPQPHGRSLVNLEIAKAVDGIEFDTNQARVALLRVPDKPGVAARLFGEISRQQVDVDLIIQSIHEGNTNDIAFTVTTPILKRAEAVASAIAPALRSNSHNSEEAEVMIEENIAKVSISGAGMIGRPGVAAQMFATLATAGVNIHMISTSEVKVSCVVSASECDRAVAALRSTFEIVEENEASKETAETNHRNIVSPLPLCPSASLPDSPPVRGVALDLNQARLAIRQVPDRPGMAAKLFGLLAQHNISVDMIIQSQRCRIVDGVARRDIAFTVARIDGEQTQNLLSQAAAEYGWGEVVLDSAIAKVSIVGSGMVGQPGVAAKMFEALAQNQINIQMIATSEIKISCVVAQEQGSKALQVIHAAFGLAGSQKFVVPA
ncbi:MULTISPECIES: aspartate kinase [unclassified Tolypothrix]|uniref:aspartate kinase n=1 Tax=unclassified Tolypothrix TaxID=2649714 RepID=UPI0005EAC271|nr:MULTISPECIES: aspartate kinase [unclassified Tolypothrix]BAY94766.1 aspartate kinase [Microchaete diplosiphon NIES-3275]EKE98993.1 aspartate kinase [Tolypothrix sp. PCC 7601]MBE9081326.1 aspartate kinase [Tolypothrix sp. LEGE 11397]UYD28450.1 aspartate kinase [Tolypothrix sp. PCC 7712]UYD35670.1 aspartate kinase [Tolypothrix sp. PCC 7601]